MPERDWVWHGTPGHFAGCAKCCFSLHTTVGEYRISSVGCYHGGEYGGPPYANDPSPIGGSPSDLYETMVFRNGPDGEVVEWCEIDGRRYATEDDAEEGRRAFCRKYDERTTADAAV